MAAKTKIEWTDATWNPVRGCTKVSPGCANCYARTFSERFRGIKGHPFEHGFDLRLVPGKLAEPLRWVKPQKIFVCSTSDLFHPEIPEKYIQTVIAVAERAWWHSFQFLTKRPENMRPWYAWTNTMKNAWWGVSVEDRRHGLPRIEHIRGLPNAFLSIEPLLEDLGEIDLTGIKWVIVGGESGLRARIMMYNWVRNIRDQCEQTEIPFFFKHWGDHYPIKMLRKVDGIYHDAKPEFLESDAALPTERKNLINWAESMAKQFEGHPLAMQGEKQCRFQPMC